MKYQRKQDLVFNDIDGEVVLLNIENGKYFGMDAVGSSIWTIIDKPKTLDEIVNELTQAFEVSRDVCLEETQAFLDHLTKSELLEAHELPH